MSSAVLYRMPNNKAVAQEIARIRAPLMGRLIRSRAQAPLEMAASLERGEHLGMLVDQHFSRGVDVTFFGRRCKANPTIARLARQFDCPVVGVRVVRLPDRRFRIAAEGRSSCRAIPTAASMSGDNTIDHVRGRTLGPRTIPASGCGSIAVGADRCGRSTVNFIAQMRRLATIAACRDR